MTDSEMSEFYQPKDGDSELEMISQRGVGTDTEYDVEGGTMNGSSTEEEKYATDSEDSSGEPSASGAAELAWKDLRVTSPDGKVILLRDAIGSVKGRFLAIMGPSGAGKTSLMNVLACRLQKSKAKGKRVLDGYSYSPGVLKRMAGYVMQDDLLFPDLTVKETLRYAAFLRMPANVARRDKKRRVKEVIQQLGLEKCQHTKVGNSLKKGISGGERKRLCVGIELLLKPRLLFLDEPTSGLDGVTALTLCRILRDLAHHNNCTVVCTIHQPATQIFNLFDDLMVLKSGQIIYHGPADHVLDHYAQAGFPCPPNTNPADHILDVISPAAFTTEEIDKADENAKKLIDFYVPPSTDLIPDDKPKKGKKYLKKTFAPRPAWWTQVWYLTGRAYKNILRERLVLISQFVQAVLMAVLIGTAFLQIGTSQYSVTRRQPVLFFVCINQGIFGALILINSFPAERLIVLRERQGGAYHASAYYIAKTIAEMSVQLIFPFVFSCIVYWLVGFQRDAGKFFVFVVFMELCSLTATSIALMVSTICKTVTLSVTILPTVIEISRLFGGFFLSPANLPDYFSWLDALSFVKYAYVGISLNELTGLELYCKPNEYKNGVCPVTSGQQTIESLGLDYISIWGCALVLIAFVLVSRIIGYLAFRFLKS